MPSFSRRAADRAVFSVHSVSNVSGHVSCLFIDTGKQEPDWQVTSFTVGKRESKRKEKNQNIVLCGDVANRIRSYPLYQTARSPKRGNRKARISQIVSFVTKSMLIFINLQTSYAFSVFVSIQLYLSKTGWTYLRRNLTETEQTTQVGPVCHVTNRAAGRGHRAWRVEVVSPCYLNVLLLRVGYGRRTELCVWYNLLLTPEFLHVALRLQQVPPRSHPHRVKTLPMTNRPPQENLTIRRHTHDLMSDIPSHRTAYRQMTLS